MNDIATQPIPSAADFAKAADDNRQPVSEGSADYLKFDGKLGTWSLGIEELDVTDEIVLFNIISAHHGFVRWGERPPAKTLSSITQPLPEAPEPFTGPDPDNPGQEKTWTAQPCRAIGGAFLDDTGENFIFETGSGGGVERMDGLINQCLARAREGKAFFPRVKLSMDYYKRRSDGNKVFKPVFEVVAWCDAQNVEEGTTDQLPDQSEEQQEEQTPTRRRRRRSE